MAGRPPPSILLACGALLCAAFFAGLGWLLPSGAGPPEARAEARLVLAGAAVLAFLLLAGLVAAVQLLVLRPLEHLARELRIVGVNPDRTLELPRRHLLGDLPQALQAVAATIGKARRAPDEGGAGSPSDSEGRQARLEAILTSLREGILVCNDRSRIVFYNPAARKVFRENPALGIGRSLSLLVASAPIEDVLQLLRQRQLRRHEAREGDEDVSFVCATLQGGMVSCRARLLTGLPGLPWSFLLTCEDVSGEAHALGRREGVLRSAVKGMRAPLTGLGLAAESLELLPDIEAAHRAVLEQAIARDARLLISQFDALARAVEEWEAPRFLANDVFVEDLVACVAQRLEAKGTRLTMIGDPLWVQADVHALLFLLEFFALGIVRSCGVRAMEIETLLGDKRVYFTYCWKGAVVPQPEIQGWMSSPAESLGAHTVGEVLERHGSEVWSRPHETAGFATLSFPVPSSPSPWKPPRPALPAREVYVDVPAAGEIVETDGREGLPLDRVAFVVFDTETTGLAPEAGDEIVSLAGVRIVDRGIVVGETFDRLVDPGRSIPPSSTRFHGITDETVRGRPRIDEALRAFHGFVGSAVLVGHNAAFDMRFIRLKERQAGVRFRGPLLDTLALSRYLHDHTPAHSLDAVARRLGVEIRDRHTALGDALATAEVFLRLLYLLQDRGVRTLGQALEVSAR